MDVCLLCGRAKVKGETNPHRGFPKGKQNYSCVLEGYIILLEKKGSLVFQKESSLNSEEEWDHAESGKTTRKGNLMERGRERKPTRGLSPAVKLWDCHPEK